MKQDKTERHVIVGFRNVAGDFRCSHVFVVSISRANPAPDNAATSATLLVQNAQCATVQMEPVPRSERA